MGVRFIAGRAGSGKSHGCFRAIVDAMQADPLGRPIYWILPKQETFTAERELTCASGLKGFCRAKVVSFELLGEEILSECGGTAIPQVNEIGRQMIIGHLLRKNQDTLLHYKSSARQVGLAAELDATFAEFERCGRDVADLSRLLDELRADQSQTQLESFIHKLTDLRLLYQQYLTFLGQERLDPHRRLEHVLKSLEGCRRIQQATLYVDGFLEFTEFERQMLVGLGKTCEELTITLLIDPRSRVYKNPHELPHEMSLWFRTEETFRKLWFAFNESGIVPEQQKLGRSTRYLAPAVEQVETHLFSPRPPTCAVSDGIEMVEAPDRRIEVDVAAREIFKYVERGLRFRDIAVLMRDLSDYENLIDASFKEHGIQYFIDRRKSAAHHPLLQFARSLLQIALQNWPHEAVMSLLKTDLAGLTRDEVDELENYVLHHRIRGSAWTDPAPWTYRRRLTRSREDGSILAEQIETERIDAIRRMLSTRIAPLSTLLSSQTPITSRQIIVELFNTFERFGIRHSIRKWIDDATTNNRLEEAGEHQQVWSELVKLLDQMADVVGDEPVSPVEFIDVLETGLERFDLGLTPPMVDQIIVGTVDRTRSARPKAVILLGMNDNQFPKPPRDRSILSDGERKTLSQHLLELDPDTERTLLDEQLLGYIALTRSSQYLTLIRSIADDEARPQSPSSFWTRLRTMFPSLQPRQVSRESRSIADAIGTPRQLVTGLMHWVRHGDIADHESAWPSLYHWLATHACCSDSIDIMRYRAWKALSYRNDATLSKETAKRFHPGALAASVSRLESFAACPFKHFVQYELGLSEREQEEITAIDLGNACHSILEQIIRGMVKDKLSWSDHSSAESESVIQSLARTVAADLRGELMLSSARNEYILQRIEHTISQVLDAASAAGIRGKLIPWKAELQFGDGREIPPLVLNTPNGREVRLRGKIDRVDLLENQAAFAVIDYKYRGSSLALDWVYHGLSLQLLTYLLVLQANGNHLAKRKLVPAAAFYVQLLRQLETIAHPQQATQPDDPVFHLRVKPRGIIDWQHRQLFDSEHTSKSSDVVSLYVKADGSMGNKNSSDGCESIEFAAMLHHVQHKLAALADQIMAGEITVSPYRIANASPCAHCDFRSVCRFDVAVNPYHHLPAFKREEVLTRVVEESQGEDLSR